MTNIINIKQVIRSKARKKLGEFANKDLGNEQLTELLVKLVETIDKNQWKGR